MSENINIVLQKMIERKASEFSLEKEKRPHTGSIISIFLEEWHLFAWLEHPLVPTLVNPYELYACFLDSDCSPVTPLPQLHNPASL